MAHHMQKQKVCFREEECVRSCEAGTGEYKGYQMLFFGKYILGNYLVGMKAYWSFES